MPEFILDTSGGVVAPYGLKERPTTYVWSSLDAFAQGYIEAMFFTEEERLRGATPGRFGGCGSWSPGYCDLSSEALAKVLGDCARFQLGDAWQTQQRETRETEHESYMWDTEAGRDFWYTRNGHGCGFWDGDWPEPYATALTDAAKGFGEVDVYLGDDGKVRLS